MMNNKPDYRFYELMEAMKDSAHIAIKAPGAVLSYQDLYNMLARNQQYLQKAGLGGDTPVLVYAGSQYEFVISLLSLLAASVWVIPINKSIARDEMEQIRLRLHAQTLSGEMIGALMAEAREPHTLEPFDGSACGVYHMTSGSRGESKFGIRSLGAFVFEAASFAQLFHFCPHFKIMSLCPLEHSFAMGAALFTALMNRAELHICELLHPKKNVAYLARNGINYLVVVPAMVHLLNMVRFDDSLRFDSLRIVLVGAGAVTKELNDGFYEKFRTKLLSNYGSTETGCVITRTDYDHYQTIGKAMPGVSIKICDDSGVPLGVGQTGTMHIRSEGMISNYVDGTAVFDSEGYFISSDLARVDEHGDIYLAGRKDNILKINGNKVNVSHMESRVEQIAGVEKCVIIKNLSATGTELLSCFVQSDHLTREQIKSFLKENVAQYRLVGKITVVKQFPYNSMGKLRVHELLSIDAV